MITIKDLNKSFPLDGESITAVDSLSLNIEKGEIFGIIGYSGAGKSTLVRLINRLEEPTSGSIQINNEEMTTLKGHQLRNMRQEIGMIFQHFNLLWSRTTEQNISFPLEIAGVPKKEREKRVQQLIELVGLQGREKAYPSQLSGGQKQRVGIARALANDPKVLLSDEATSALDPDTTKSILNLLLNINKKLGITMIVITHEMDVIQEICDRVAIMDEGKVIEQGKVIDVFTNPQHEVTKRFVSQVTSKTENVEKNIDEQFSENKINKKLYLRFPENAKSETLISDLSKKYNIDISILDGKITQTRQGSLGTLTIEIYGSQTEIQDAKQYIENRNVIIEVSR